MLRNVANSTLAPILRHRDGRVDQDRTLEAFGQLASGNARRAFPSCEPIPCSSSAVSFSRIRSSCRLRSPSAKFDNGGLGVPLGFDVAPEEEDSAAEIKRLQSCINDLVSIVSLLAAWRGGAPSQILQTLLDALLQVLQLDLVYARLKNPTGEAGISIVRVGAREQAPLPAQEISEQLDQRFGEEAERWAPLIRHRVGGKDISIAPQQLGLQGEIGMIAAGSWRMDFPMQTERLRLSVATKKASIGLQEAGLLSEQRRVTADLDQRVAQRTLELSRANEELQLRVGLLQHIPVAAWTVRPDGTPDFANHGWLEYTGQTIEFVQSDPAAWMTAIHPEDRERAAGIYWEGIGSGQGFTMEARFRRVYDGTYRWHLNRAVALRDEKER
jgi:PAS domain S-box-containing protein